MDLTVQMRLKCADGFDRTNEFDCVVGAVIDRLM